MKCIIVDDEDIARAILANFIKKIDNLDLIASCNSPIEAYNVLNKQAIDLIFLDIQMPEMTGVDFFESLSIPNPMVIFTTAYSEYAIESYDLEALDYLLKPIRFKRFMVAVQKAQNRFNRLVNPSVNEATITIKSGYDLHKVFLKDILYIEGMKEYVAFHTKEQRIMSLQSLKALETLLPSDDFMRVHRSYIVQKTFVKALINKKLLIGEKQIPIGERYLETIKENLF